MPSILANLPRKARFGIGFIYLAGLGWGSDVLIPFSHLPHKAVIFAVVLGIAELSFIIGLTLLGKTYYRQLKTYFINALIHRTQK